MADPIESWKRLTCIETTDSSFEVLSRLRSFVRSPQTNERTPETPSSGSGRRPSELRVSPLFSSSFLPLFTRGRDCTTWLRKIHRNSPARWQPEHRSTSIAPRDGRAITLTRVNLHSHSQDTVRTRRTHRREWQQRQPSQHRELYLATPITIHTNSYEG